MTDEPAIQIEAAQVILPCSELDPTLDFFTGKLGFRVAAIYPADDPSVAVVSGHGLRVQLQRGAEGSPGRLRLLCRDPKSVAEGATEVTAPNGTRIELVDADPPLVAPPAKPEFVLSKYSEDASWGVGRAGMRYRDLIPSRLGGSVIASHIQIPQGGPVPDYVHFHKVRFQMIYSYKGWARLVYEDQGPPFVLQAGDCVLQPPRIRHRVLECSDGMEVVEIGLPAQHETFGDLKMELPTLELRPDRVFGGQRFVRHDHTQASWRPWSIAGFECRDTGIGEATDGVARVRVARPKDSPSSEPHQHGAELLFLFVLRGSLTLKTAGHESALLNEADAVVVPKETPYSLEDVSTDLELLEVALPAAFDITPAPASHSRR